MNQAIDSAITQAGTSSTVGALFRARALLAGSAPAVEYRGRVIGYAELGERVKRTTAMLAAQGLQRGDRVALLSRNRPEYLEIELAAANLGVITACLNWRLSRKELTYCVELVSPKLLIAEADLAANVPDSAIPRLELGEPYERLLAAQTRRDTPIVAEPEDGLVILYTSGTTGLPKGAIVSHRAMVARAMVFTSELHIDVDDAFVAWAPMFHMASTDHALATLLRGGTVVMVDGFQAEPIVRAVAEHKIGWLVLIPGMVDAIADALRATPIVPRGIRVCGAMADLVPSKSIAAVTELLQAPYLNSFGSTETGLPPATRGMIPIGEAPARLSKRQSAFCEIKLVDPNDNEVAVGQPGELAMRGPTLFSGYWEAHETNARDFRGGWFHMGDVMRRNEDGTLDFVDRAKYMIKSGGENVYPAEIERVLLMDKRISEAAVVRAPDAKWGEVPVAFVALRDETVSDAELAALCRRDLAGYKRPREFHFIGFDDFPRSTSGKVQRHELEARLAKGET
ncbi:long-chain-fatty-acid--CoA ligase [Variibacter gotjawalensis]|uniref:Long-chain-fatty-acid--CoA ligase n=1 Tax=Variibacter gotjawalensis TaxID=1333996 RepID=A0A0S3PRG9_9BRAD|nr:AMP-binding protein [Variibacter gotjawalensis]NIK48839.1 fatty-acyl-CoA synthase [Variibacter gotjawalensis]RZS50699.1 fatty-acyl-CoA synthase [Variibacter gotjawalensis]BAT58533.1 long-chain-fatty-acid--CoA ligase [Variibacter gotjawalensis]